MERSLKRLLLVLALLSFATGVAAWVAWSQDLLPDAGAHGEHWDRWNSAINVTWAVMEIAFPASVVFAIAYLFVPPRSPRAIGVGLSIVGAAAVVILAIWFIMSHLTIG